MKKYLIIFVLLSFMLIFPVPGQAFDKWPDTGQTTSHTNTFGEDSDYNINPQSYTKLDASGNNLPDDAASWTMVRDNVTDLIWEAKTDDGSIHDKDNTYTWCDTNPATNGGNAGTCGNGTDTTDFIAALNTANYGDHNDWRLPTIKELSTIVNSEIYNTSINRAFFPNSVSSGYWSSTPCACNTAVYVWHVNFYYGYVSYLSHRFDSYYVRAVRGGNDTATTFVDNGDGTITDTSTGLMWQKATGNTMNWEAAITYCETLPLASYSDWRLPDRNELQSIVDYSRCSPTIDTNFFPDTVLSNYWSSTTIAYSTGSAWHVSFHYGYVGNRDKSSSYYVRAVRAGQSGSFGNLAVNIEPVEARNSGAQWRVAGGAWHDGGYTQSGLVPGNHIVEFKTIDGWTRPANQQIMIIENQTSQIEGAYSSTDFQNGTMSGIVTGQNSEGVNLGTLQNALVEISGHGSTNTDSQGEYSFSGVPPGTYSVIISKLGYYSATKQVIIEAGATNSEHFQITLQQISSKPGFYNFSSPDGNNFVSGIPEDINFETTIGWNGSSGSVRFLVSGQWHNATITELGGGQAKAELSIPAPGTIDNCSELTIEITNGEGETHTANMGVHFYPLVGAIPWYQDDISWTPSGASLSYSIGQSWDFDLPMSSDDIELEASLGYSMKFQYDLMSATLSGSLTGEGGLGFTIPTPQPGLNILGDAALAITGKLAISLAGCESPTVTPYWGLSFNGKSGVEAPVVLLLDTVAPGVGSSLASIPKIKDIKLQLFLLSGGSLSGDYTGGQTGDCLFGSSSTTGTVTGGIEALAKVDFTKKINAGVYVGGTGTFQVDTCPDLEISGFTGKIYAGAFVQVYSFKADVETAAEIHWDFTQSGEAIATVLAMTDLGKDTDGKNWHPIGNSSLKWGKANRLPLIKSLELMSIDSSEASTSSEEESILENLTWVAHPSILLNGTRSRVLYALYDTEKPWYQSSDIAEVVKEGSNPWSINRITDDTASEFSPRVHKVDADNLLATWSRVDGDVSAAEEPEDIVPYLEIIACFNDISSNTWGTPAQLTDNDITDRKPMPISFGTHKGVLWIQNQGTLMVGNATFGDSLMYSEWNGTSWVAPVTLWSGQKGIIDYSFVSDALNECHIVLSVDEDGDTETLTDLDLYHITTVSSVWLPGLRLTNDSIQDSLPLLVNPDGNPILVWSSDSILKYSSLSVWNPKNVYSQEALADKAPSLDGVTFPGGAAIAYSAQSPEGVNMFATFYDSTLDQWSLPRQLTDDQGSETSMTLAFDGTELVISYLKTQTLREDIEVELNGQMQTIENVPQPGRTDLYILRHTLGHDLAAKTDSLIFDPVNPTPGTTANIEAIIENLGDITAENVLVKFYDGDPSLGGILIDQSTIASLIAGASQTVTISWVVPSDLNSHTVFAVVDPDLSFDDRDRTNNTISAMTVLPDLVVETSLGKKLSNTQVAITSKIVNAGVIPSGRIKVHWYLDNKDGAEIGSKELDSITANSYRECTLIWDSSREGLVNIYTIVDVENVVFEPDESNNSHFVAISGLVIADSDGDNIPDNIEDTTCTDTNDADTDDDGIPDGIEDANQDGIIDPGETDPCNPDSDNDGIQDGTESGYTLNDIGPDTDTNIFIPDADPDTTTDPLLSDSDGDGFSDGEEDLNKNGMLDPGESDPNSNVSIPQAPTVITLNVTLIAHNSASSGGNVTSGGGGAVTARGVCWNTTVNPTINNSKTSNGTGTGSFTSSITDLKPNTVYHVRAYATNNAGTAYGGDIQFTTESASLPWLFLLLNE